MQWIFSLRFCALPVAIAAAVMLLTPSTRAVNSPNFVALDLGSIGLVALNNRGSVLGNCRIFSNGITRRLVSPFSVGDCTAFALNDNNQVFGIGQDTAEICGFQVTNVRTWFYDGIGMRDIGVLAPEFPAARGHAMNNGGQIVGQSYARHPNTGHAEWHAFVVNPGGKMIDLGLLPRDPNNPGEELFSSAVDINDSGSIRGPREPARKHLLRAAAHQLCHSKACVLHDDRRITPGRSNAVVASQPG